MTKEELEILWKDKINWRWGSCSKLVTVIFNNCAYRFKSEEVKVNNKPSAFETLLKCYFEAINNLFSQSPRLTPSGTPKSCDF